jgi:hypothetical protein
MLILSVGQHRVRSILRAGQLDGLNMGWVGHLKVLSRDCSDCDKIAVADFAGNTVRTTERTAAAEPGGRDRERNPDPTSPACHGVTLPRPITG